MAINAGFSYDTKRTNCTLNIFILILQSGTFFETEETFEREQKMSSRRMGNGDVLFNQLASQKPQKNRQTSSCT